MARGAVAIHRDFGANSHPRFPDVHRRPLAADPTVLIGRPMYIADHARLTPDKPAIIIAETGEAITYRELDERSLRLAQLLRARGFARGDHIAILMENNLRYMEVVWAAFR